MAVGAHEDSISVNGLKNNTQYLMVGGGNGDHAANLSDLFTSGSGPDPKKISMIEHQPDDAQIITCGMLLEQRGKGPDGAPRDQEEEYVAVSTAAYGAGGPAAGTAAEAHHMDEISSSSYLDASITIARNNNSDQDSNGGEGTCRTESRSTHAKEMFGTPGWQVQ